MILVGADTLRDSLGTLPAGLDVYASYVDNFGGFPELLGMRDRLNPHGIYFSYTIFGNKANFADVESGAMHPTSVPSWLVDGRGTPLPGTRVPGVYTSSGVADDLFSAVGLGGLPHGELPKSFIYQSAHYGAGPHICGPGTCGFRQAHGTQWADAGPGGQNYDRALWLPGVLRPVGPPPDPNHYDRFYPGPFSWGGFRRMNEREIVKRYDVLRAMQTPHRHPHRREAEVLKRKCRALANRIWWEAHQGLSPASFGKGNVLPDWSFAHRGWRFKQLAHRSKGERVAR